MEQNNEHKKESTSTNEDLIHDLYKKTFHHALEKSENDTDYQELRWIIISFCAWENQLIKDIFKHTQYHRFYTKYMKEYIQQGINAINNTLSLLHKQSPASLVPSKEDLYQSFSQPYEDKDHINDSKKLNDLMREFDHYISYIDEITTIEDEIRNDLLCSWIIWDTKGWALDRHNEIKKRLYIGLIVIENEQKLSRSYLSKEIRNHEKYDLLISEYDERNEYKQNIKSLIISDKQKKTVDQPIDNHQNKEWLPTLEQQNTLFSYQLPPWIWPDTLITNTTNALDIILKNKKSTILSLNSDEKIYIEKVDAYIKLLSENKHDQQNILSSLLTHPSCTWLLQSSSAIATYWKRVLSRNKQIINSEKNKKEITDIFDILDNQWYPEVILKKEKRKKYEGEEDAISFPQLKQWITDIYMWANIKWQNDAIIIITNTLIKNSMYNKSQWNKKKYYYGLAISTDNNELILYVKSGDILIYYSITHNENEIYTLLSQWWEIKNNQIGSCIVWYNDILLFQQESKKLSELQGEFLEEVYEKVYDSNTVDIIPWLLYNKKWRSYNDLTREKICYQLNHIYKVLYDTYGDNKPTLRSVMNIDEIEKTLFELGLLHKKKIFNLKYQLSIGEGNTLNLTINIEYTTISRWKSILENKNFVVSSSPFLIYGFLSILCGIEDYEAFLSLVQDQAWQKDQHTKNSLMSWPYDNEKQSINNEDSLVEQWLMTNTTNIQDDQGDEQGDNNNELFGEFLEIKKDLRTMSEEKNNLWIVPILLDENVTISWLNSIEIETQLKLYMGHEYCNERDDLKYLMWKHRWWDALSENIFSVSFFLSTSCLLYLKIFNPNSNEKPYICYSFWVGITDKINEKTFFNFLCEWGRYPNDLKKTLNNFDDMLWGNDNNPNHDTDMINGEYFE